MAAKRRWTSARLTKLLIGSVAGRDISMASCPVVTCGRGEPGSLALQMLH